MQDILLMVSPIAVALYFLEYPAQLTAVMNWLQRLIY
jgi:hypothetical protein